MAGLGARAIWRGLIKGVPRSEIPKYKRRVNKKQVVEPFRKWRILRGDTVQILSGRDAGQQGVVQRIDRKRNKVEVTGMNLVRKHVKKTEQAEGGIFSVEAAIHVSRVNLVCPETKLPTRVRMEYLDDGTAVRVAARSGAIIERPSILMERRNPRRAAGLMDTAASDVVLETNDGAHPRLKQF